MALVTFLVMHATPGSPLDPVAEGANPLSPEAQKNLAEAYGLDKPLWYQFGIFISKAVRGDFGQSFVYKTRTVTEIMVETFPISLLLGSMALVLAVVGGRHPRRAGRRVPEPLVGLRLGERGHPRRERAQLRAGRVPDRALLLRPARSSPPAAGTRRSDWVLPTITLALAPDGHHRALHALEHDRGDPLRLHRDRARQGPRRAAGHPASTCSRTRFIPVVTLLGPMFAAVGTGSFFVESIFRVPGMGRFFVLSMTGRDYPMIMAVVLIYGAFLALMNLVVDLLYGASRPPHPILACPRRAARRWRRPATARSAGSSLWRDAWRRLLRNKLAVVGGRHRHPAVPARHLRRRARAVLVHQAQLRPALRVSLARVPARHRSARARRALADDLRRARLDAGGPRARRSSSC